MKNGTKRRSTGRSKHYVDRQQFYNKLVEFIPVRKADPKAKIPDEIGEIFMKIAEGLSSKGNFSGYHMIDDMRSEAIYLMSRYITSFNPEKSNNPFGYFTQIAFNAFVMRINDEKKQMGIRSALFDKAVISGIIKDTVDQLERLDRGPTDEESVAQRAEEEEDNGRGIIDE